MFENLKEKWKALKESASALWSKIKKEGADVWKEIKEALVEIKDFYAQVKPAVVNFWNKLKDFFKALKQLVSDHELLKELEEEIQDLKSKTFSEEDFKDVDELIKRYREGD